MKNALTRAFGGLGAAGYFRHLFFALVMYGLWMSFVWMHLTKSAPQTYKAAVVITVLYAVNTVLYPYSRDLYERVMGFLLGNNVFILPGVVYLFGKLLTMVVCWGLAIFIAPIALIFLAFRS